MISFKEYLEEDIKSKMPILVKQFGRNLILRHDTYTKKTGSELYNGLLDWTPEKDITFWTAADPTYPKCKYITWILRLWIANLILPEDSYKIRDVLDRFDTIHTKNFFKDPKDINQYKNFTELYRVIKKYEGIESKEEIEKRLKYLDTQSLIAERGDLKLYHIGDWKVLNIISQNTAWCTKSQNVAREYMADNKEMYLITKNNNQYRLISIKLYALPGDPRKNAMCYNFQCKNTNDEILTEEEAEEIFPLLLKINTFNKMIPHLKNGLLNAYNNTSDLVAEIIENNSLNISPRDAVKNQVDVYINDLDISLVEYSLRYNLELVDLVPFIWKLDKKFKLNLPQTTFEDEINRYLEIGEK